MFSVERKAYPLEKQRFRAIAQDACKKFPMTNLAQCEFEVLRATIRARGLARPRAFLAGLCTWAVTLVAILAWLPNPVAAVIPLLLLVGSFEVVRNAAPGRRAHRTLRPGVLRRGGRRRNAMTPPAWERTAMAFGPSVPGAGGHPLYLPVFLLATVVNLMAVMLPGPLLIEARHAARSAHRVPVLDASLRSRDAEATQHGARAVPTDQEGLAALVGLARLRLASRDSRLRRSSELGVRLASSARE